MRSLLELDVASLRDAIVIVDVDGTITHDGSQTILPDAMHKLQQLVKSNRVYLCSNASDHKRLQALANVTGAFALPSTHKKPSVRVLDAISDREGKRIVVIGDKRLTDGRFAKNIGAEFIQVTRMTHASDRTHVRAIYTVDKIYSFVGPYLHLMRPSQWIKNLLVFAPVFFADTVFNVGMLGEASLVFLAFSAAASAVYIMNDLADREQDRAHPIKRARPLAAGEVTVTNASILFLALIAISAFALFFIPAAIPALIVYILLNALYSFSFKHMAVVDILCVASFYVMRVLAGGAATGTYVSPWIILCVLFGALVLVIGKRRAEFAHASRRSVMDGYSKSGLDFLLAASATLAVVSYALYSVIGARSSLVVYSTVFVVLAVFRLLNHLYRDTGSDAEFPETLLFKDRPALIGTILWAVYMFVILYLHV